MAQEMYKNDALLHLVWSVATCDQKDGADSSVTPEEDKYLGIIRSKEGINIDWDDFNAKRKSLGSDREVINHEACKALRGCGKDWKIKCLGYMKKMAWVSQENDLENNIGDKEWELILHAQKELGLTEEERTNSHSGLPSGN
jgi:hypothetical protein